MKSNSEQQKQTEAFFTERALEWDNKARGTAKEIRVNVIKQRNDYVLDVVSKLNKINSVYDVGCGVGDLSIQLAARNIKVLGVDFAKTMIDLAKEREQLIKLKNVEFIAGDYFDIEHENGTFDLIVANGFLEYISFEQRDIFLNKAYNALSPGGSLIVSSRNRLFNIRSLNSFTTQEIRGGHIEALMKESIGMTSGLSLSELIEVDTAEMQSKSTKHDHTGIGVDTRYQYTPVQLINIVTKAKFKIVGASPIHIHGLSSELKSIYPKEHLKIANKMQEYAHNNLRLIPLASAFMLHAQKD